MRNWNLIWISMILLMLALPASARVSWFPKDVQDFLPELQTSEDSPTNFSPATPCSDGDESCSEQDESSNLQVGDGPSRGDSRGDAPQIGDSRDIDSHRGDSRDGDSQGSGSRRGDSQGGDSQGSGSRRGDSQGGDSQGTGSRRGDSQGGDSQGTGSRRGDSSQGDPQHLQDFQDNGGSHPDSQRGYQEGESETEGGRETKHDELGGTSEATGPPAARAEGIRGPRPPTGIDFDPPSWLESVMDWLKELEFPDWTGKALKTLGWILLVLLILVALTGLVRAFWPRNQPQVPDEEDSLLTELQARTKNQQANELAKLQDYNLAIHALLLDALRKLEPRHPLIRSPSATGREIAREIDPSPASPLLQLVKASEMCVFAVSVADEELYHRAKEWHEAIVSGL